MNPAHYQRNKISCQEILFKDVQTMSFGIASECIVSGPAGVDGAVGVPDFKWFVAIVNPRHEKSVSEKLKAAGLDSYVATQSEMHLWKNGRRKLVDRVIIPSIVFVRCTERQRREIVKQPYILRFMVNRCRESGSLNRPVAEIPDSQIRQLQFMLGHADAPVEFVPSVFLKNDKVRVIRGNLKGLEGVVISNSDGTHSLTISISILGIAKVIIEPNDIEKI